MSSARLFWILLLSLAGASPGSHGAARAGDVDEAQDMLPIESSQELDTCREMISLNGTWDFSYDPKDVGEQERWFADGAKLAETTTVPGCDQANDHPSAGMSEEDYAAFHRKYGEFMMFFCRKTAML